jgi:hypothetical protein
MNLKSMNYESKGNLQSNQGFYEKKDILKNYDR